MILQAAETGSDGGGRIAPLTKPFQRTGLRDQEKVLGGVGNEAEEKWVTPNLQTPGHQGGCREMEEDVPG